MIGLFDSGIGGLSIFREIHRLLPDQSTFYIGDQAHVPYGPRPQSEVRKFTTEMMRFLINEGANPIVIACNTASGAALQFVRKEFPETEFVGLVPAIKPAAESTQTGHIGVLATPGTFRGKLYLHVKNEFAADVIVYQDTVPGLVEQIENGLIHSAKTREILEKALLPMLAKNIDRVVLGCTHYPFAEDVIREIIGPDVEIIEPGAAVARRVQFLLGYPQPEPNPQHHFSSTGDTTILKSALQRLLQWEEMDVKQRHWRHNFKLA
jgi:glutamate racemase